MGSEGPPAVTIHVTGFKKFHGVSENPTETIVSNLNEYMKKKGLPKGVILGSCSVLETAGHGAIVPLYQTFQNALKTNNSESSNSGRVIWVSCPHVSLAIYQSAACFVMILFEFFGFCLITVFSTFFFSYTLGLIVEQQNLPLRIKLSMKLLFGVLMRWDGNHRSDIFLVYGIVS